MKTRHLEADQWLNRKEWCLGACRRRQLSRDRKDRKTKQDKTKNSRHFMELEESLPCLIF